MSHTLPWGLSPLSGWRGVASASGGFPEPAAPSYGAPGVEFMGLHRENNAVVQIYFLPGQVRPPRPSYSHIFPKERHASGGPGCGVAGRTWDHHLPPKIRGGLWVWGSLRPPWCVKAV